MVRASWRFQQRQDRCNSPDAYDETGEWLRGDIAGLLCARYLNAKYAVTPISCNTAVEKSKYFISVTRSKVGSPYVIAGMEALIQSHHNGIIGYEANGGFLQADELIQNNRSLSPLPARDAIIVILAILAMSKEANMPISGL